VQKLKLKDLTGIERETSALSMSFVPRSQKNNFHNPF